MFTVLYLNVKNQLDIYRYQANKILSFEKESKPIPYEQMYDNIKYIEKSCNILVIFDYI